MLDPGPEYQTQEREILVKVENVSKKFCRSLKKSLWYGVQDITSEILGRKYEHDLRPDEFWSIKDVSFELRRGECLGLIGPNGAGKSTLLKMLNGLIKPDRGRIEMSGRVGALIELGTGFNPVLTGRENIYNNAAVLGLTKKEVDEKLDSIIEFAEISDFLDMPVQNYSSGMKVRLGFAVAAHLKPDVLIIDEVLAVGDIGFRAKCYNQISQLLSNSAVILVSHSIPHIDRYCNKIALLDRGKMKALSDEGTNNKASVISNYYSLYKGESPCIVQSNGASLVSFEILDTNRNEIQEIEHGSPVIFRICINVDNVEKKPYMWLLFLNRELQVVAMSSSKKISKSAENNLLCFEAQISSLILNTGDYKLSLSVFGDSERDQLLFANAIKSFRVTGSMMNYAGAAIYFDADWL